MKARQVEDILKNKGLEKGTAHILSYVVERMNYVQKACVELAVMQEKIIDTLNNVTNGSLNMKKDLERRLKKAGLAEPDDDLDPSTESIQ